MIAVFSSLRAHLLGLLICAVALFLLPGCSSARRIVYTQAAPLASYHDIREGIPFRRIAMLPLCYERETGNSVSSDLDGAFHAELTKTTLFEVIWISRSQMEALTGHRQISSVEALPGGILAQIAVQSGADAVLFTDVTHYFPYLPISVGVRSKLVDVRTGEIRWGFDHLFDSGKPEVAVAARHYYLANSQTNLPVSNDGNSVLQSPSRFAGYAAWETYRSLINKPVEHTVSEPCISSTPSKVVLKSAK